MINLSLKGVTVELDGYAVTCEQDPELASNLGRWLEVFEPMTGGQPEQERARLLESEMGARVLTYTDPMMPVEEGVAE